MFRRIILSVVSVTLAAALTILYAIDWNEFEWSSYNLKFNVPAEFSVTANNKKNFIAENKNSLRFTLTTLENEALPAAKAEHRSSEKNSGNNEKNSSSNEIIKPKQFQLAKGLSATMTAKRQNIQNTKMIVVELTIHASKHNSLYLATWSWHDDEKNNEDNLEISYDMAKSFQLIE